jgi:hypothetical protein
LRFYPDGFALGTVRQVVNCESNLPGSQVRTFEPLVMSKNVPDAWVTDANAKVKVNGVEHYLKKFTYTDREKYYVVADENSSHPKIFVPCEKDLPEEVSVNGADGENANIEWELVLGNSTHKIAETLVVAGDEPLVETFSTQAQPRSLSMQSATVPRSQTDRGWQQPGDAITMDDLLRAFNWIYPDDFSQLLLQVYQAEGHEIILTNVLGDYDFAYWKRPGTSKAAIKIEHNDNDVNPAIAAQYLWRGLNEALVCVADYRAAILAASPGNEMDVEVLQAWRSGVGAAAAGYALAATELYLAGISILNEGLDWALVINDVAEGHYTALVAALPFIPHGLIKAGQKSLRIRNTAGELLEEFATAEKLDAAKQLYRETDLRVMGVTMERENFSAFMRKALAHDGGPIKPPKSHGGLRRAMLKFSVPPSGKTIAHHDFPWLFKKDFADHGIDVNNPAFGRWIDHETHVNFHQRMNPKFNGFWREFFRNEIEAAASESVYTMKEIMEKLAEARAIYVIE